MNFSRRNLWLIVPALLVLGFALFWWFSPWRRGLEEQGFRLLPPDGLFAIHVDVAGLRDSPTLERAFARAAPALEADYGDFVRGTGFNWERDLDTLDVAVAGPPDHRVVNALLTGRFHREKIDPYLASRRKSSTFHVSVNIDEFTGPSGRPLRIAFLGSGRLLFSNAPGPEPMMKMAELSRRSGESLGSRLRDLGVFERVPRGTQVWASADLERGAQLALPAPGSDASFTSELLHGSRVALASARLASPDVALQVQAAYSDDASAERVARGLNGLRSLLRALAERRTPAATRSDWEKALDAINVTQEKHSVLIRLQLDAAFLTRLFDAATSGK